MLVYAIAGFMTGVVASFGFVAALGCYRQRRTQRNFEALFNAAQANAVYLHLDRTVVPYSHEPDIADFPPKEKC